MKKLLILTIVSLLSTVLISCGGDSSDDSANTPDTVVLSAPSNLTATPSSEAMYLSWTGSEGATYRVHQSTETFSDVADYSTLSAYQSTEVNTSSIEITGLMNNTTYHFVVTALRDGQESAASNEAIGIPDESLILPVTNLVASASSGSVNLSWTGRKGATYRVHQSTETFSGVADYETLSSYSSYNVTATSTEITDLTNGTLYYFVVTALKDGKESLASNEVSGRPDFPPPPSTPTSLTVTSASSGTVNLSWTGSEGATYRVHQSTQTFSDVADYGILSAYQSTEVTTSSIEITGLTNGVSYYFVVTALKDGQESPASNEISGRPDFPPPPSTPSLTVTSASSGTVNLSWTGSEGATYRVHQSTETFSGVTDYSTLSAYQSTEVTTSSIEITGLTNGVSYYFVVTALRDGQESPASNEVSGRPDFPPPPSTPTSLTVTSASSGTVNLSWTGSEGATYRVHQSTQTFSGVADYSTLSAYQSIEVTTSSIEITGLTNGVSYYFVVTALKDGQESPASNEVSGRPDFPPPPSTPTSLTVTSASSGTVNLSWTGSEGATYRVHQSTETFSGVTDYSTLSAYQSIEVTTSSIEITGLTNGVSYYFVVTALRDGQESPASDEVIGLPDFPIPSTPTDLTATLSSRTVNLNWTSSEGVTYRVHQSTQTFIGVADYSTLSAYQSTEVNTSSIEITGLTNGVTYYFVVTALKNGKESPASNEVSGFPDESLIPPVTNLMVSAESSGSVNLSWTGREGATYRVHQSTETFSGVADYETLASYSSYNVTATSTEITDLTNGTLYYFVVTALKDGKESLASNEVIGFPDFPPPTPTPMSLTVTSVSSGTVYLSWNSVAGATYKVHQSTETFASMVELNYGMLSAYQSTEVNTTSSKITGLTNDTTYYFVVTALINGQESTASNEVSGTPFAPRPLNDTGITWAGNYPSGNTTGTDCTPTGFAAGTEQDCHQGRDASALAGTLTKIGGGKAGFDYTKLGSTGTVLSIQNSTWSDSGSESSGTKWSCVRDNVSGAVWEVKSNNEDDLHYKELLYTFESLLNGWVAFVNGTNQENLCGYNDWRVPTLVELDSIVDLSSTPSIDANYFPNTGSGFFWSSSRDSGSIARALSFDDGGDDDASIFTRYHVRLIRSSFTVLNEWPDSRYTDHKDGTVTDNVTGLMWAKCPLGKSGTDCSGGRTIAWGAALEQASASTLANYDDWRVPNRKELRSIVVYDRSNSSINENLFPNSASRFWSSSPGFEERAGSWDRAWQIGSTGQDNLQSRSVTHVVHVRFVRSSQ